MAIYVYITRQCAKDADKQNYSEDVERFKSKLESLQSLESFDRFPPPHLKKRFERQIRLVAGERQIGDHLVVVFLRLLVRGGSEYKQFGDSDYKTVPGVDKMEQELSDEGLSSYVESRQDTPMPPPPCPSDAEESYLHAALTTNANIYHDSHCCETHLWVERMKQPEFESRLAAFVNPVLDTIGYPDEGVSELRCKDYPEFGILFRRIPEAKMVILLTPFRGEPPIREVRERFGSLLDPASEFNHEVALQKAKHAYAHEIILNEDAWFQIQKGRDGSMALSLEEVDVLESARNPQRAGFPLFINGRAGSGKSTILQYLFSEYLYHHLVEGHDMSPPVLFACSDLLLSQARNSVRELLKARHRKSNSSPDDSWMASKAFEEKFQCAFQNFYSALLNLLPPGERERFPAANLITYGRFKVWWERRFAKDPVSRKLYDADVSWHVIRTYIKGTSTEGLLEPEDYAEIPAKHKTVTPETYGIVFDKVWSKYAEDQSQQGLWDHQDLARHVLEHDLARPIHPVIMCDEAQDFTRIELELIDRHCLFNARRLHAFEAEKVPIAFAGDPFQTLNPTGFRWESTKAFFVEKFIKSYTRHDGRKELNFRELSYNYRSSQNIVRFCNSLQLVRSVVFGIPDLKPQIHWHDEVDSPSVVYFDRTNAEILGILKKQSEIRIIVPCEEGGEAEWVRQNGLAEFVSFDDEDVPKNVVSAVRVKGLEFPRVVLFGFGGACPQSLKRAIQDGEVLPDTDQSIEPQYFLNRLYVAASRPRKRLFVIDHAKDIDGFWKPIFDKQDTFTLKSYETAAWEKEIGSMMAGDPTSWESDREDPAETADKLAEEGKLRKDRVLLRQAALSYETAKAPLKAKCCRAEAMEIEGHWLKAASLWEELGQYDRAVTAAWQSIDEGPPFLIELADRHAEVMVKIEYKFADFLNRSYGFEAGIELLKAFEAEIAEGDRLGEMILLPSWRLVFSRFVDSLLRLKGTSKGLWSLAYQRLKSISEAGMRIPAVVMGKVAFAAERMKEAHDFWLQLDASERSGVEGDFLRAKIAVQLFPSYFEVADELLRNHRSAADAEMVLRRIVEEDAAKLRPTQNAVAARCCLIAGRFDEGAAYLSGCSDEGLAIDYVKSAAEAGSSPVMVAKVMAVLLNMMADAQKLQAMLDLMSAGRYERTRIDVVADMLQKHPTVLFEPLVKLMGSKLDFELERNDLRMAYLKLLLDRLPGDLGWRHTIHPLIVGLAFERIGVFKETLPYYERLKGSTLLSEPLRVLARQRWILVKMGQAQREREQGNKRRAENYILEINVELANTSFRNASEIPGDLPAELPPVDAVKPEIRQESPNPPFGGGTQETVVPPMDKVSIQSGFQLEARVDVFQFKVNAGGTRVHITNSETLEQLSMFMEKGVVNFDGESLEVSAESRCDVKQLGIVVDLGNVEKGEVTLILANRMKCSIPVAVSNAFQTSSSHGLKE
jgi:hypothetical protein